MAPSAMVLIVLLVLVVLPSSTLCSRAGPSSKHGHGGGHAKRVPPPASVPPPPPAPAALVRATCNSTSYYDLCVAELSADPSSATADVRGLSSIAVSAAAANASGAAQAAAALANATDAGTTAGVAGDGGGAVVQRLLATCAAKYGDARDALAAAKGSIAQQDYDMASVHVSAAAEYPQVCRALFARQSPGDYPPELAATEVALRQLCSVALDIIALLSSSDNN
uniref:Pectinesterase inhibitor domain-containing protein n=1 Tax=Oryza nivara TaxID=4536 RepID=A0A0E0J923_ORYNI